LRKEQHDKQVKALVAQILAKSQGPSAPNREQAVSDAVAATAQGAAEGDAQLQRALELLQANNIAEAVPLLRTFAEDKERTAASAGKEAATAHLNLGAIAGIADPKCARETYGRAVALDPDNARGLCWAGWFELDAGNLRDAEMLYKRLLRPKGKGATKNQIFWAEMGLGDIALERGNLPEALKSYRDGLVIAERLAKADPQFVSGTPTTDFIAP
jgi:tetratricopeptide (TPR) repeat protein